MTQIDYAGVAPLRRGETQRRIDVIRKYLTIRRPRLADREAAAARLGVSAAHFYNLVRAWRTHGAAVAIATAGAEAGRARPPRSGGLPVATRAAAEQALRALPTNARHKDAIAAVREACERRGTRPPSDSMVSYLRLASRRSDARAGGDAGVVVGRALAALPMIDGGELKLPEVAVAVDNADGTVVAAALVGPDGRTPEGFVQAIVMAAKSAGGVTIGLDDGDIAAALPHAAIISRFAASRRLAHMIGRRIDGVRLSYGPLSSTDPKRALRSKWDEPMSRAAVF